MLNRADRIANIVLQTIDCDDEEPMMFSGCYLGATGGKGKQAFVHGLFGPRLGKEQNNVKWTKRACDEDAASHASAHWGYVLMVVAWLAFIGLGAVWTWMTFFR